MRRERAINNSPAFIQLKAIDKILKTECGTLDHVEASFNAGRPRVVAIHGFDTNTRY